ncbi:hypothetical protein ABZX88_34315 [Kitasatospora aureofaciens]
MADYLRTLFTAEDRPHDEMARIGYVVLPAVLLAVVLLGGIVYALI